MMKAHTASRALEKLRRELGPVILKTLAEDDVVEIALNPDGQVWVERLGSQMMHLTDIGANVGRAIIETVAGYHGFEITAQSPTIEGELPIDGSRFAGQIPPIVRAPTFAIRKKAIRVFSLREYADQGSMTSYQKKIIEQAIQKRRNILVAGGTGSGKTTLVNAIIDEMVNMCPNERIVIIEDTDEINCNASNSIKYRTSDQVSMTKLIRTTLRMRPDRILVGEVRGMEALDLLDAWNTGHEGGVATLHANSAFAALKKLSSLATRNPSCPQRVEEIIAEVVDLLIFIKRTPNGRKIDTILNIEGFDGRYYQTQEVGLT